MPECKICGNYICIDGVSMNFRGDIMVHKCQPCWLIRHDDNSIKMFFPTTFPDNFTVYRRYAYDAEDAAKKVAEELFSDKDEYKGIGITFLVVRESNKDAKPIRVCVTIDYSTTIVED